MCVWYTIYRSFGEYRRFVGVTFFFSFFFPPRKFRSHAAQNRLTCIETFIMYYVECPFLFFFFFCTRQISLFGFPSMGANFFVVSRVATRLTPVYSRLAISHASTGKTHVWKNTRSTRPGSRTANSRLEQTCTVNKRVCFPYLLTTFCDNAVHIILTRFLLAQLNIGCEPRRLAVLAAAAAAATATDFISFMIGIRSAISSLRLN